jgi:hypothetical protein
MSIIDDFLNEDDSSMLDREFQQKHGSKDVYNFLYTETLLQKIINVFKKIVKWQ